MQSLGITSVEKRNLEFGSRNTEKYEIEVFKPKTTDSVVFEIDNSLWPERDVQPQIFFICHLSAESQTSLHPLQILKTNFRLLVLTEF